MLLNTLIQNGMAIHHLELIGIRLGCLVTYPITALRLREPNRINSFAIISAFVTPGSGKL